MTSRRSNRCRNANLNDNSNLSYNKADGILEALPNNPLITEEECLIKYNKVIRNRAYYWFMLARKRVDQEDLIIEAQIALLSAMKEFDPEKSATFGVFLERKINWELQRYLNNYKDLIRKPVYVHEKLGKLKKFSNEFVKINNRKPTCEEIANEIFKKKLDPLKGTKEFEEKRADYITEMNYFLQLDVPLRSIDEPVYADHDFDQNKVFSDVISRANPIDNIFETSIKDNLISELKNILSEESAIIVMLHVGLHEIESSDKDSGIMSFKSIEAYMNNKGYPLTERKVQYLYKQSIKKLQKSSTFKALFDYRN